MENTIDVQLLDQELFAFWAPRCSILKQGQLEISYTTQAMGPTDQDVVGVYSAGMAPAKQL